MAGDKRLAQKNGLGMFATNTPPNTEHFDNAYAANDSMTLFQMHYCLFMLVPATFECALVFLCVS